MSFFFFSCMRFFVFIMVLYGEVHFLWFLSLLHLLLWSIEHQSKKTHNQRLTMVTYMRMIYTFVSLFKIDWRTYGRFQFFSIFCLWHQVCQYHALSSSLDSSGCTYVLEVCPGLIFICGSVILDVTYVLFFRFLKCPTFQIAIFNSCWILPLQLILNFINNIDTHSTFTITTTNGSSKCFIFHMCRKKCKPLIGLSIFLSLLSQSVSVLDV